MTDLPKDQLRPLREMIEQQRNTVESLKRDGHQCPDAERQLHRMLGEFQRNAKPERRPQ